MNSQEEDSTAEKEDEKATEIEEPSVMTSEEETTSEEEITEEFDLELDDLSPETEIVEVEIKTIPYLKMILHSLKYAHPSKGNWIEIIGLMTGYIAHKGTPLEHIVIEDAFPIGHGEAVTVEIKDYNSVTRILKDKKSGSFVVGWYHSHPGYGLFLSGTDIATQKRYQKLWNQSLALVLDPTLISSTHYGFEIFRLNETFKFEQPVKYKFEDLRPLPVPDLIKFLLPLVDGEALFLEYENYQK